MSVPISALVNVIPSVIGAAGNARDLLGLFITNSPKIPAGKIKSYSSLLDVSDDFEATTPEYQVAAVYFKSYTGATQTPSAILFVQYNQSDATPAVLSGGNLGQTGVDQIKALTGTLTVNVSKTPLTGTPDFSKITTLADAATAIQTALDAGNKNIKTQFVSTSNNFVITTIATGSKVTISAGTGTVAAPLKLDTASASESQGMDPLIPADFMNRIIQNNTNWATFTTIYGSSVQDKLAFSAWCGDQKNKYLYVDAEAPDLNSDDWSKNWLPQVIQNKTSGTCGFYENTDVHLYPAFLMGCVASLDFTRLNGRTTAAFRTQAGLRATYIGQSEYDALTSAGYNVYCNFAAAKEEFNFIQKGSVTGDFKWVDTYTNQIWLNANLQLRTVYVLKNNPLLPYNRIGYSKFAVSWGVQGDLGVNYGAIQTGVTLDPSQLQQVASAVGFDVSDSLSSKGYYIDIKDAPASVRVARGSPPATFYYVDGGSIQSITLASIAIL